MVYMRKYMPMLISDGDVPLGEDWTYQIKWDGVRCIAYITPDKVKLLSREGFDFTTSFPEVAAELASTWDAGTVLDGEIITVDMETLRPSFELALIRAQSAAPIKVRMLRKQCPSFFMPFDVLEANGVDLTPLPFRDRLASVDQLKISTAWGFSYEQIIKLVASNGHEGFVARNLNAPYIEGERPPTNIRWKNINTLDAVIYGYEKGDGVRYKNFGAFHCKVLDDVGGEAHVSSGFPDSVLKELIDSLEVECETDEFVTVKKDIIIEINYLDIGSDNKVRNPSFSRVRADKVYK